MSSLRDNVDATRIRHFFEILAKRFREPARFYLVGGTSLVFQRLRKQTIDIDITFEVHADDHGQLIQAIRELKDELQINVEEVSPADFIPLPLGYQSRHCFIERFGTIDIFHFDFYCTVLSKIERGGSQDFDDVISLLQAGVIEWQKLVSYFHEILPQCAKKSLKQDPQTFQEHFQLLEQMWTKRGFPGTTVTDS